MTIVFKISDNTKEKMMKYFENKKRIKTPPYAIFQADEEDTVITLYQSGKVMFQGISADIDAAMWKEMERHLNPGKELEETKSDKKDKKDKIIDEIDPKIYNASTIGSDEVGTGDYFGPLIVTSAYVSKDDIKFVESLGVKDSKKLNDENILEIAPKLIKKIKYESIILNNSEYNEKYGSNLNLNKIKAIMHNKVLISLTKQINDYDYVIVDQFAKPFVYFNYLKEVPNVFRKITFMTKAEDKCLSVACASIISRYIFINEFDKISKSVGFKIPKGAGSLVDDAGVKIVLKYGFDKLNEIAKYNFKNTEKIKKLIEDQN